MISVVMASWRARFMTRVRVRTSSSALSVAAAMARCWAVKNDAAPSNRAAKISASSARGASSSEQLLGLGLELGVALERSLVPLRRLLGSLRQGERQQLHLLDPLGPGGDEPGGDHLHEVDLPGHERRGHDRRDVPGVGELGAVGEAA